MLYVIVYTVPLRDLDLSLQYDILQSDKKVSC